MGYSLDNSTSTAMVNGTSINAQVSAGNGSHTLHVKAWGSQGAACDSDVAIAVTSTGITVNSPIAGSDVTLPFVLSANAATCYSQPVTAMGYSLDSSTSTAVVNATSISTQVSSTTTGEHTLHVKAWGSQGSACDADIPVNVVASSTASSTASSISVSSPTSSEQVTSPFQLSASASTCSSQSVTAMGYSLDSSTSTTTASGTAINTQVSASTGSHTLHVKSWGSNGAGCVVDVGINVLAGGAMSAVPSNAISVSSIQALSNWTQQFDSGTGSGTASGLMSMVGSPSISGHARRFVTNFSYYGGERYNVSFGDDTSATNFLYDTWVYLDGSSNQIANLEFDLNQTMPNGQTVIFGFQCDGWSSTWDYTANKGTPQSPYDTWVKTNQYCNPRTWGTYAWHHVQILYSRDSSGNVTYKSVWLDDKQQAINATVNSAFALGWGPALITNLQVDELSSGTASATVYLDNTTVYRW